jgi:hypothetical protein
MDMAERFDADITVEGPSPNTVGTFLVKRPEGIDHDQFMVGLLGAIGSPDRLVMHHRSGFAVVVLPYGRAQRLKAYPWVETVGGIRFDPERFAAVTGATRSS